MILRLLNVQGLAGIAGGIALSILLLVQKIETAHWKKQSASLEQLYRQEQSAFAVTVADTRAAATQARAADQANASRVAAEQASINQRTKNDFEARISAARTAAGGRLQLKPQAAADPGDGGGSPMPGLPAAAGSPAQVSDKDRLPHDDALIATEQAIQLDELIKWVRSQATVDNNPRAVASPLSD
jgi:hypothetical protein